MSNIFFVDFGMVYNYMLKISQMWIIQLNLKSQPTTFGSKVLIWSIPQLTNEKTIFVQNFVIQHSSKINQRKSFPITLHPSEIFAKIEGGYGRQLKISYYGEKKKVSHRSTPKQFFRFAKNYGEERGGCDWKELPLMLILVDFLFWNLNILAKK